VVSEKDIAFPKLTAAQIATLESRGHRRAVRSGDVLFTEGARGYSFYVVVSGAIEIVESSRGTPHTVVVHHPQDFTGDVDMLASLFFVERRMGRWDDAIAHYRETLARDPRNVSLRVQGAREILFWMRRFDEMRAQLAEALKIAPDDAIARACLAELEQRLGRLDAADAWLARVPKDTEDYYQSLAHLTQARYRRNLAELTALIEPAVASHTDAELTDVDYIGLIYLGHAQRQSGRSDLARATFERLARAFAALPGGIDHVAAVAPLSPLVDAGLGDTDKAIASARHRAEMSPDALERGAATTVLAQLLALKGDREAAIALLPNLLEMPAGVTPAMLILDPLWDPIRDDPRFVEFTKQPVTEYKGPPHG